MKYLPRSVLEELESIKKDKGLSKDVLAFDEIVNYCRVGRETERIMRFGLPFKKGRGGF
jgi:hypothetical protein